MQGNMHTINKKKAWFVHTFIKNANRCFNNKKGVAEYANNLHFVD